ncbi:MAG: hypothetical protein ACE5MI_12365 [Acidimicrobiia bacterium]
MNRIRGLVLGVGLLTLIVAGLACGADVTQEPAEAGPASEPPQAQERPSPSSEPVEVSPPVTGGGAPRAPVPYFSYEGVIYHHDKSLEAAQFGDDDFELAGSTTESNRVAPGGSLNVYVLKGDTEHVYTFEPGNSFLNEDGRTITTKDRWARWGDSSEPPKPSSVVSSGMMVPRPESIEDLVAQSDVIVLGTISFVLEETLVGDLPHTDYEVRIDGVLKSDGALEDGGTLVLRMSGHLTQQTDVVTSVHVQLPAPDSYYMLALGQNPDGTYGSGPEGLLDVDGDRVTFADGIGFWTELTGAEFVEAVRQEAGG